MKWFKDGELHRLEQPIGKQYSYGKGFAIVANEVRKLAEQMKSSTAQIQGVSVSVNEMMATAKQATMACHDMVATTE